MSRHYVAVDGRQVHYRRAGAGPPVVLLHQTPQSSVTMLPLLQRLAGQATVVALDTPGFGLSDPLPGESWSIDDLAEFLGATLDALGIERAAFAGQHTGATIAAEFALRYPKRAACLALDGYTAFTAAEREAILPHQTLRYAPRWDGGHLTWAWARFRDGWMFFPWAVRSRKTRRDLDMPDPQLIQTWQLMELLRSGESYRAVYPGVFAWEGVAATSRLTVPTLVICSADDQLFPHLDRLDRRAPPVVVERRASGDRGGVLDRMAQFICSQFLPGKTPPVLPAAGSRCYADLPDGRQLHVRRIGEACPLPFVYLHGAGASGAAEIASLAGAPSVVFDLPGHGDSDQPAVGYAPEALAADIVAALDDLGIAQCRLGGRGLGAAVAVEIACRAPSRVHGLLLDEVGRFDADEHRDLVAHFAPPVQPVWDGTHLNSLWHQIRDAEFFFPWYRRVRACVRPIEPNVAAERIDRLLFDALRCADRPAAYRAWFEWPAAERMAALSVPVTLRAWPGDIWARDLPALAASMPGRASLAIGEDHRATLAAFLGA